MINFLYSIYSIVAGVFAYLIITENIILALLFLLIWELIIFLYYARKNYTWSFRQRFFFGVLYFFGYFSSFILYKDLKFEKPF